MSLLKKLRNNLSKNKSGKCITMSANSVYDDTDVSIDRQFKLFDFNIINNFNNICESEFDDDIDIYTDNDCFSIQMFGINEKGHSVSIIVNDFKPFFYVKVGDSWNKSTMMNFIEQIQKEYSIKRFKQSIITKQCKIVKFKKLYGFDDGKLHKFVILYFTSMSALNAVKNLWYNKRGRSFERSLSKTGYISNGISTELYEANIPPILRFFHIKTICPSGWIQLNANEYKVYNKINTTCNYNFEVLYDNILPLNEKDTIVPFKIMSFDIEASSSHGDFPVPIKSYKKLATNIVTFVQKNNYSISPKLFGILVKTAFKLSSKPHADIELVYPKHPITYEECHKALTSIVNYLVEDTSTINESTINNEEMFEKINKFTTDETKTKNNGEDSDEEGTDEEEDTDSEEESEELFVEEENQIAQHKKENIIKNMNQANIIKTKGKINILTMLQDTSIKGDEKILILTKVLSKFLPELEGDKVTFIGSTFLKYGEKEPYLNHCICLNTCDKLQTENTIIESYKTEKQVLLAWTKLINRENPDIIIGYNIFGFDYEFMFRRTQELNCTDEFLKLSRNIDEICINTNYVGERDIDRSSITLSTGTYDLSIIKMTGRVQIDMLNWFRRKDTSLSSYKLDNVASVYICDTISKFEYNTKISEVDNEEYPITRVYTKNMKGLYKNSFIHFEVTTHSTSYYKEGEKYEIIEINYDEKWFEINGHEEPYGKIIKWGLAKDDLTPKDLFRMANEGASERAIVAKYCIQDCNLVQQLFSKVDAITDLSEMARVCSVPINFLIFRGQGIKLTSFVAKECREKNTLMPVINKGSSEDAYEGATVLTPKSGLYLEDPSCVGDFASLYPSSMLSENYCPSSKVLTKSYDLNKNLVGETGEKDSKGNYKYLNLPNYKYVDIEFPILKMLPNEKGKRVKTLTGYKVCTYVQPTVNPDGTLERAIMPTILQQLLKARKDTRKLITKTDDEFVKNILDKRQLAYKETANSLYGQLGAKTSTFYEPDIAASTTATGRMLLTFAKRVLEECYNNVEMEVNGRKLIVTNEYLYGDTDSVFFKINMIDKETNVKLVDKEALECSIPLAKIMTHTVSTVLKQPHDFEYEKTFLPFCLLSKKKYVAIKYEDDPNKGKRIEMGIVLKRRDNAPIVKDVYGGIIDILMKEKNVQKSLEYLDEMMNKLKNGDIPMSRLIISKSLKGYYKYPNGVAHKVLADRIASRDSGNKPNVGDRLQYVYIIKEKDPEKKKMLQGEKIETPSYIIENNIPIDYDHYITNQVMKPLLQLYSLVLEDLLKSHNPPLMNVIDEVHKKTEIAKETIKDDKKLEKKIEQIRGKEVEKLLFSKYLTPKPIKITKKSIADEKRRLKLLKKQEEEELQKEKELDKKIKDHVSPVKKSGRPKGSVKLLENKSKEKDIEEIKIEEEIPKKKSGGVRKKNNSTKDGFQPV